MLTRIRKGMDENEEGFTLIELLVVIIIIGILAAIAIPVFLNQRQKGYDAQAKSDLRNLATIEETYLTDFPTTYGSLIQVQAAPYSYKKSANVTGHAVALRTVTNQGYVLKAKSDSTQWFCYSSDGLLADNVTAAPSSGVFKDPANNGTC
jgi:type IV pilus assembly protein PilA